MKKLLSLFLIVTLFNTIATATHVAGADITYACTSTPGIFKVILVIYRDCQGIPLCSGSCTGQCPQTIIVRSADPGCSSLNQTISCQLVNVRDANPEPLCPTATNICSNLNCKIPGTFAPAFERYQFEGFVNLGPTSGIPANCCNISLAWELCCRNSTINTGPANQNFYTNAIINRCLSTTPCNSSPNLYHDPITYMCSGQNAVINYGAADPDGDSLSFAFAPVLISSGTSAYYSPPYSFDRPMPWTGSATGPFPAGIRCDPLTGDILFTPGNNSGINFTGVMGIEIKQWRNIGGTPTVMGITRRDAQMVLLPNCQQNNIPRFVTNPPAASNPNMPKLNWQVCTGQQLCFTVTAKDTDVALSDTTRISWDTALIALGATFEPVYAHSQAQRTTLGPREDEWRFCWTPTASQARKEPYLFTITAKDNRCPSPGRLTSGFTIQVGNPVSTIPISINKLSQDCNRWMFSYSGTLPLGAIAKWEIARNPGDFSFTNDLDTFVNRTNTPSLLFRQGGLYAVRLIVSQPNTSNCDYIFYDTLTVPTNLVSITTTLEDTIICAGNPLTLSAIASLGRSPYSYRWFNSLADTNSTALNSNTSISSFTLTPASSKSFIVQVRDSSGCRNYDSTIVSVSGELTNIITTSASCNGGSDGMITAVNNTSFQYLYRLNNGNFTASSRFDHLPAGNYALTVKDSTNNCLFTFPNINVTMPPMLKDTLVVVTSETCKGAGNASIIANATGGKPPYRYSLDSITFNPSNLFNGLNAGVYKVYIKDSANCDAWFTRSIAPLDTFFIGQITTTDPTCFNASNGIIHINAAGGTRPYRYQIGLDPFGTDSIFNNLPGGGYTIRAADNNNCMVSVSTTLVNPAPISISSIVGANSTNINKVDTYSFVPTGAGLSYAWTVSKEGTIIGPTNTTTALVRWDSAGTGTVNAYIFQNASCADSSSLLVAVSPTVGINEMEKALGVNVFPNPTNTTLNIVLNQLLEFKVLKLYDIQGKLILEQPLKLTQTLDLTPLPKGVYVLQIGQWHKQVLKN